MELEYTDDFYRNIFCPTKEDVARINEIMARLFDSVEIVFDRNGRMVAECKDFDDSFLTQSDFGGM